MDKKKLKLVIIFLIIIISGVAVYYLVFKKKESSENTLETEEEQEPFTSCSEITDENVCNTVENEEGDLICEYNSTFNNCRNKSRPAICADPNIVKSQYLQGNNQYTRLYEWISDAVPTELLGAGKYKLRQSNIEGTMNNLIIIDPGEGVTEYCEWEKYDIPYFKTNPNPLCRFNLQKNYYDNLHNLDNGRVLNRSCEGDDRGNEMFLVTNDNGNCIGSIFSESCDLITNAAECQNKYTCAWIDQNCQKRTNFQNIKQTCGRKTPIMDECYQFDTSDTCPDSSCIWNSNKNRCLPIDYPFDSDSDITSLYTFDDFDCVYEPGDTNIYCYSRQ